MNVLAAIVTPLNRDCPKILPPGRVLANARFVFLTGTSSSRLLGFLQLLLEAFALKLFEDLFLAGQCVDSRRRRRLRSNGRGFGRSRRGDRSMRFVMNSRSFDGSVERRGRRVGGFCWLGSKRFVPEWSRFFGKRLVAFSLDKNAAFVGFRFLARSVQTGAFGCGPVASSIGIPLLVRATGI